MQADRIYCGDALTVLKTLPDSSVPGDTGVCENRTQCNVAAA